MSEQELRLAAIQAALSSHCGAAEAFRLADDVVDYVMGAPTKAIVQRIEDRRPPIL